jgi:hypothetical protein
MCAAGGRRRCRWRCRCSRRRRRIKDKHNSISGDADGDRVHRDAAAAAARLRADRLLARGSPHLQRTSRFQILSGPRGAGRPSVQRQRIYKRPVARCILPRLFNRRNPLAERARSPSHLYPFPAAALRQCRARDLRARARNRPIAV